MFPGSGQLNLPRRSWRENALGFQWDRPCVALPSPFLFSPKNHHHSSYENPLGTNGPCLSRPLPDLGACSPPFPFPSFDLHGFLEMSCWLECCLVLPVALWPPGRWLTLQWTGQQRDRRRGGARGRCGGRGEPRQANVKPPQTGSGSSAPASPGYCSGFFSGGQLG